MKKVLIITYYWPPAGGPGVQRWLKFSKYLPDNDVDVCVLTVDPELATYPIIDKSLEKEVKDTTCVHRTQTKELFGAYKKATNRKAIPFSGFASEDAKPDIKEKVARFVRGNFFYPDPRKGWRKYALHKAKELVINEGIEVVITTGPPHSTHLIGLDLKKETDVKWIADFRDPWTDIYYYRDFYPMAITRNLERALEADAITAASPGFAKLLAKKIEDGNKITAVTNGYDQDDLQQFSSLSSSELHITYTGTLSEKYPLATLVQALYSLERKIQAKIILNIVGTIDSTSEALLKNKDWDVRVNLLGYVSHADALSYLAKSHILLLLIPSLKGNEGIIPAKIFEYIGAGKQILGVGPIPSDAADVVDNNDFGKFFLPEQTTELSQWIKERFQNIHHLLEVKDWDKRAAYSRKNLSKTMAEVIKSV